MRIQVGLEFCMINTRKIAADYRLAHWAGIMRERTESGLTVKAFCETRGFHPNSYFYWQRKLRESACGEIAGVDTLSTPGGWAVAVPAVPGAFRASGTLPIEIGKYRVLVGMDTDERLLVKVCGVLASLC
jgi:putative transposase